MESYTLCGGLNYNVVQRGCDFQMELLNMLIHLKITLPLWDVHCKSSTGGELVSDGAAHMNLKPHHESQY